MRLKFLIIIIAAALLWGCSGSYSPVVYDEEGSGQAANTTQPNTSGTVLLADQPEFYEPFTASAFTAIYYNNLIWKASIATMTGGCLASMDNLALSATCAGDTGHGYIHMTVPGNTMGGAEIITWRDTSYHYGLYECRMKCSSVPGVVNAFFWQGANRTASGMEEIDIEFLSQEFGSGTGKVHFTIHPKPADQGYFDPRHQQVIDLNFNPADGFHVYSFDWTEDLMTCYVDYQAVCTFKRSEGAVIPTGPGLIWLNTWTGNPNFGGGPPLADATQVIDWVKFWPAGGTGITDPLITDN